MENTLAGVAGKKFILSYSCGKDSTLCLHKMLEAGAEPMALLVMFNPEAGRSYFHGVDPALLREYGEALELPLLAVPTGGEEYHLSMEAALRRAKEQGAELVCFGDIDMENNRAWGEERCRNVGLEAVYPLWHHDRQENVREVLELGVSVSHQDAGPPGAAPASAGSGHGPGHGGGDDRLRRGCLRRERGVPHHRRGRTGVPPAYPLLRPAAAGPGGLFRGGYHGAGKGITEDLGGRKSILTIRFYISGVNLL